MKTALFASLLLPAALALVPTPPSSGDGPPPPAPSARAKLDDLLEQLGSKRFKVREESERQLSVREDAAPPLRRLLSSPDQELRRRAARILEALERGAGRRAREGLEALAKQGEIDQVIERLVRRPAWGTEEDAAWQVLAAFAGRLLDVPNARFPRTFIETDPFTRVPAGRAAAAAPAEDRKKRPVEWQSRFPFRDFLRYKKTFKPVTLAGARVTLPQRGGFVIRAEEVCLDKDSWHNLIACSGHVSVTQRMLTNSGIFAGGSVTMRSVARSVIVCDGEFKADVATGCIIIARGPVTIPDGPQGCLIVSADKINIPKWFREEKNARNVVRENEAVPLGFVKFFDPERAGITVAADGKELAVKAVTPGKRFARAGLRPGDVLLSVDGTVAAARESFRRLLRGKLAEEKDAAFKVRRADKTLEIRVPCKD